MSDFITAYKLTCRNEGGYVNDASDSGGETYGGITRKNFPYWPGWPLIDARKPLNDGAIIVNKEVTDLLANFYRVNFWDPIKGDEISDQDLANQVFDMAVNAGVGEALKLLNEA